MTRLCTRAFLLTLSFLCLATRIAAHHSFGAEYDADKPITLKGVITKVDWANPHCHMYIDVKEPNGTTKNWKLEGFPPNVLSRTGCRKDVTLKPGDTITVFAWLARNGSALAHAREITFSDGKKLYFGPPAGTGEGTAIIP